MSLENFSEGNLVDPVYIICGFSNTREKIFSDFTGKEFRKLLAKNGFNKETTLLVDCFSNNEVLELLRKKKSKCVLFLGMQICQFLDIYYCHLNTMRNNIYEYIYLKEYNNIDLFSDDYNIRSYNMISHDYRNVFFNDNLELRNTLTDQLNHDLQLFNELGSQLLKGKLINAV